MSENEEKQKICITLSCSFNIHYNNFGVDVLNVLVVKKTCDWNF